MGDAVEETKANGEFLVHCLIPEINVRLDLLKLHRRIGSGVPHPTKVIYQAAKIRRPSDKIFLAALISRS